MSSPGQKRGSCGHAMAIFDGHAYCARCRDKGKGEEPCVANKESMDCAICNTLTPEQRTQLATLSYKLKKEKREAKRLDSNPSDDVALVDPDSVSVIGVVGDSNVAQTVSAPPEKKPKKDKAPTKGKKSVEFTASSTDSKISQLDEKWAECFNRLEALLLSKSLQPTFSSEVRVTPSHSPPSGIAKDTEPFFQPTDQQGTISPGKRTGPDTNAALQRSAGKLQVSQESQKLVSSERTGPDVYASQHQSAGKLKPDPPQARSSSSRRTGPDVGSKPQSTGKPMSDKQSSDSDLPVTGQLSISKAPTDRPSTHRPLTDRPGSSAVTGPDSPFLQTGQRDSFSNVDSQPDSELSDQPPLTLFVDEGELSDDQEFGESEQPTSEEQTYRETMSGICSFMGWSHVPDMESSNPSDDNPFAGPKAPVPNKVSVHMPTEEWLCKKLNKLNMTLIEGYPSRTAEAGHLPMDSFLIPARSQNKWYGLYPGQEKDTSSVTSWHTGSTRLNGSFGRISRKAGMTSTPPASRRISQDTLRKWEKSAREASVICNQSASFNRCLLQVQQEMQAQFKTIHGEAKHPRKFQKHPMSYSFLWTLTIASPRRLLKPWNT